MRAVRAAGAKTQGVPPLASGEREGISLVTWTVRVLEKGTLPVRVESTTGYARTKRITITEKQGTKTVF